MSNQPNQLPYKETIANKIREGVRGGLTVRAIFASIQTHQDAPASLTTFYKLYQKDLEQARAEINAAVGSKVIEQALEGDYKSQELFLRSRGDWSPQSTQTEIESDSSDEDLNAVDALMQALGKLEELESEEDSQ